jgi:hypothetical protein
MRSRRDSIFQRSEIALERSRAANSPVSGRCPPLASIRPWLWGAGWDACTDVESVGFGSGRGCLVIGADAGERRNDRRADRDGGQPCQKLSNGHAAAHPTAPAWDTQNGAPRLLVALALQEVQFSQGSFAKKRRFSQRRDRSGHVPIWDTARTPDAIMPRDR